MFPYAPHHSLSSQEPQTLCLAGAFEPPGKPCQAADRLGVREAVAAFVAAILAHRDKLGLVERGVFPRVYDTLLSDVAVHAELLTLGLGAPGAPLATGEARARERRVRPPGLQAAIFVAVVVDGVARIIGGKVVARRSDEGTPPRHENDDASVHKRRRRQPSPIGIRRHR